MSVVKVYEKPKLRKPVLVEGLPGVGNIGRVAVGYLVDELKAKKFATLYSEWFFPFVMLSDKYKAHLLKNEFYYYKAKSKKQRDIIFLVGDCQSLSPQGHYEVMDKVLDLAETLGVKEVVTVGGLATGELGDKVAVIGAVTDKKIMDKYKKYGINFNASDKVGYIVGATGLLLGLGAERNMNGICILGQTTGFPIVTDPRAAENVLTTLTKMLGLRIDMSKLEKKVKEMEDFIKKIEALQKKALSEISKTPSPEKPAKEELRYIG
jgi:uncharacterized protein (TIGR00162 family)